MKLSYDEKLRGRPVIDGSGRVVGDLDNLFFDSQSWKVESLCIRLKKEVAETIGEPHGTFKAAVIEIPVELVLGLGETVVLKKSLEQLARATEGPPPAPPQ